MYVCLCEQITDKDILEMSRRHNITNIKELCKKLKLGRNCGQCLEFASEILDKDTFIKKKDLSKNA